MDVFGVDAVKMIQGYNVITAYCLNFAFDKRNNYAVTRQWEAYVELNEGLAAEGFPRSSDIVHGYWFAAVNSNDTYLVTSRRRYLKTYFTSLCKYQERLLKSNRWQAFIVSEEKETFKRFDDEDKCGYLTKEGHIVKNWKKRWFVLKGVDLYYFENKSAVKLKGLINLTDVVIMSATIKGISDFGISIIPSKAGSDSKEYLLYAETKKSADSWIKILSYKAKMYSSVAKSISLTQDVLTKSGSNRLNITSSNPSLLSNSSGSTSASSSTNSSATSQSSSTVHPRLNLNHNAAQTSFRRSSLMNEAAEDGIWSNLSALMKRVPTPRPMQQIDAYSFNLSPTLAANDKRTTKDVHSRRTAELSAVTSDDFGKDKATLTVEEVQTLLKTNLGIFFQDIEILRNSLHEIETKAPTRVAEAMKAVNNLTDISAEILNKPVEELTNAYFDEFTMRIRKFYEHSGETLNRYVTRLLWICTAHRRNLMACTSLDVHDESEQDRAGEVQREMEYESIMVADDQICNQYLKEILKMAMDLTSGVQRVNHVDVIGRTTYECFLGSELVSWLIQGEKVAATREQGEEIGNEFIAMGEMVCVAQSQNIINRKTSNNAEKFHDSPLYFYRFTSPTPKRQSTVEETLEDFVLVEKITVCRLCDSEIVLSELMNHNFFCHMMAKCESTCKSVARSLTAIKQKLDTSQPAPNSLANSSTSSSTTTNTANATNGASGTPTGPVQLDQETILFFQSIIETVLHLNFDTSHESEYEVIMSELETRYNIEVLTLDDHINDIPKDYAKQIHTLVQDKYISHKTYVTAAPHLAKMGVQSITSGNAPSSAGSNQAGARGSASRDGDNAPSKTLASGQSSSAPPTQSMWGYVKSFSNLFTKSASTSQQNKAPTSATTGTPSTRDTVSRNTFGGTSAPKLNASAGANANNSALNASGNSTTASSTSQPLSRAGSANSSTTASSSGTSTPSSRWGAASVGMEDFDILKIISSGGFGKIYLAQKKKTGDIYAIKSQHKTHLINKNVDIINEKNAMEQGANHPFVCNLYYAFQSREKVYLVMEYLPGGDLASLLHKFSFFNEKITRQYMAEITLILQYLHSIGIIHRDIKPHNFLISNTGHLKITDFGLAKIRNVGESMCDDLSMKKKSRKRVLGTPDYLSPEVLLGYEETFAVDWWALGVIGFELLTGIPPFSDDSVEKIFQHIVNREIYDWPDGTDDTPIVSENSKLFIDGLLQIDPKLRLGSGERAVEKIKKHVWFETYDWGNVFEAEIDSLLIPDSNQALVKSGDLYDAKDDAYISFSNGRLSQSTEIPNYSFVNLQSLNEKNHAVMLKETLMAMNGPNQSPTGGRKDQQKK